MADIQLRFNRDLLVLSTPVREQLEKLGVDTAETGEMTLLLEPEVYDEIYMLEAATGAQCLVTDTAALTPARLAHSRMADAGARLAHQAIEVVAAQKPQHILAEIGPCGLPLDASSKTSLLETRDQYVRAVGYFAAEEDAFDAYFLNGFRTCTELKCALMGLRKVSDKPIFASVDLVDVCGNLAEAVLADGGSVDPKDETGADGVATSTIAASTLDVSTIAASTIAASEVATSTIVAAGAEARYLAGYSGHAAETLADAVAVMAEYGAQVVGFKTAAPPMVAAALAQEAMQAAPALPILVQLDVRRIDAEQKAPTLDNPYFEPDVMVDAADELAASGVQFMRAVGAAIPSYTGALVAATLGDEVQRPDVVVSEATVEKNDPAFVVEMLRARVNDALGN